MLNEKGYVISKVIEYQMKKILIKSLNYNYGNND